MKFKSRIRPWYRKADDWWYVTRTVNGRRVQHKLVRGEDNEDAAYRKFYELMAADGAVEAREDATFNQLAAVFLCWAKQNCETKTVEWYGHFILDFDGFYDGPASELTAAVVQRWLRQHDWGQSSERQAITCIKRVVQHAYDNGLLKEYPPGLRKLRRPPMRRREKVLSEAEHRRILEHTDAAFRQFLFALKTTGARPGEVRTVTANNVDLERGLWIFEQHKTASKTNKPRVIYLTLEMIELTTALMAKHPEGPLFRNSHGKPWSSNAIRCRMRRLRSKLGLDAGTVAYSYRHTFATDGLENGVPIADMAELLGHTDTKMVSEHYSKLHTKVGHLRDAARKAAGDSVN